MINVARLDTELKAAGLPIDGVSLVAVSSNDSGPTTYYVRVEGLVRVCWPAPPTAAQDSTAASIVAAHDGTDTEVEKLDKLPVPARYLAALLIRASDRWAPLSAARKARVMAVIDAAADAAIAKMT